jgi:hypothetical protein
MLMSMNQSSARTLLSLILAGAVSLPLMAQIELREPPQRKADDKKVAETPEKKKEKAANERLAKDLLIRASAISKQLSDSERAYLLAKLAQASTKTMKEQSKAWADEVFQLSAGLPADAQRSQNEMTAMMAIAENDSGHGLELLTRMEAPAPRSDGQPAPDMRSMTATMLFQKIWQKRGAEAIDSLQAAARQLGETGNYPYMAMASIIRQVGRKDTDKAQTLTNDALAYFSRRARGDQSAQQMAMFLRANREYIPQPMMKDILTQLVADALDTKNDTKTGAVAVFSNSRGTATMSGAANLLLFQLLPMIRDIDPDWAKKMEAQSSELQASANLVQGSNAGGSERMGMFIGGPNGGGPPANMMEEMKSIEVDELANQNPKQALKVADEIHDPVIRAATTARLAGDLSTSDPDRAAELLKNAREALAASKEPADKLRILVGLAQAQKAMKDKDGFGKTLDQAYVMGEELFRKSFDKSPDSAINSRPGIDQLTRLTIAGVRLDSTAILTHLDNLRSPLLQAILLVAAARGLDPDSSSQGTGYRIQIGS